MRIKNKDKDFERCVIGLNGAVYPRGDVLEASEEEGKIWIIDDSYQGYHVIYGTVTIILTDVLTATELRLQSTVRG